MYSPSLSDMTRKATGIGIVCGLEILVAEDCTLTITAGYGFTSKGTLIHCPKKQFKYYRTYEGGIKSLVKADEIDVWEITEDRQSNGIPITPQIIGSSRFIDDKVVILYLEEPYRSNIRVLLIDKEDLWELIDRNNGLDPECIQLDGKEPTDTNLFDPEEEEFPNGRALFCAINRNTSLSPIYCMRFGFATDESECDPEEREFKIESEDFDGLFKEYELIILDGLEKLQKAITALHEDIFHDLLPKQQRDFLELYFAYLRGARWFSFKQDATRSLYIQYFHDLIKDLIATYNELLEELCALMADCCPDENLFPCHLLLGEIQEDIVFGHSVFRHHFRQPPIYNDNRLRLQKIRFLHWRMVMQIKTFYIPNVETSDFAEAHYTQLGKNGSVPALTGNDLDFDQIKITPSKERNLPLGKRTIPYYYYIAADPSSMHQFWNFDAVYCCKTHHLLSYHAEDEEGHTDECAVKRPLGYQPYPYSYFRVEGVIGQQQSPTLIQKLQDLKLRFNLDFKLLALSYADFFDDPNPADGDFQIHENYLGVEHIAGFEKGGYYIMLHNEDGIVTADFWLSHCCVENMEEHPIPEEEETEEESTEGEVLEEEETEEVETVTLSGVVLDCQRKGVNIPVYISNKLLATNEDGKFSIDLEKGDYNVTIRNENYYIAQPKLAVKSTRKNLEIRVLPKKSIEVTLAYQFKIPQSKGRITVRSDRDAATKVTDGKLGSKVNFDKLEGENFKITWTENNLPNSLYIDIVNIAEENIQFQQCEQIKAVNLTAKGRAAYPPFFSEWPLPEEEIPYLPLPEPERFPFPDPGDYTDPLPPFGTYAKIWDERIERIKEGLNQLNPSIQNAVFALIAPILYEYNYQEEAFDENYNGLMTLLGQQQLAKETLASISKDITEMHLERAALSSVDLKIPLKAKLEQFYSLDVIESSETTNFLDAWQNSLANIIEPIYLDRIISLQGTALKKDAIKGLGAGTVTYLKGKGITTFEEIAQFEMIDLQQVLADFNSPSVDKYLGSWSQQAQLFLDGKIDELAAFKQQLP